MDGRSGRENLSLHNIREQAMSESNVKDEVVLLNIIQDMKDNLTRVKDWRNRRGSHNDLSDIMNKSKYEFPVDVIDRAIANIRTFIIKVYDMFNGGIENSLDEIKDHIEEFLEFLKSHPKSKEIGVPDVLNF